VAAVVPVMVQGGKGGASPMFLCSIAAVGTENSEPDARGAGRQGAKLMRTAILVILLTATAASAIAMRVNPLAVSYMVDDRRPVKHAVYMPITPAMQHAGLGTGIDAFFWQQHEHIGPVAILAQRVPRAGTRLWPDDED
jgi:hypothetical protein